MNEAPVIRVVKKKAAHAGHHGGAWKVAYADFVTAMMAFFLVMWIISMDQATRQKIQDYFQDPFSSSEKGISTLAAGGQNPTASGYFGIMNGRGARGVSTQKQTEKFKKVKKDVEQDLEQQPGLKALRGNVEISVDTNGLSINLLERSNAPFFERGSAVLPPAARALLVKIGKELGRLRNHVVIEGHTDVTPYSGASGYTNWELSSDRAGAARRVLEAYGMRPDQVLEVRACADRFLRDPEHPTDASNRRVSILVPFQEADPNVEPEKPAIHPEGRPAFEVDIQPTIKGPEL